MFETTRQRERSVGAPIGSLTARDIMQPDPITVTPESTIGSLVELLLDHEITGVPVVDRNGAVKGVVSLTDVAQAAAREGRPAGEDSPGSPETGGGTAAEERREPRLRSRGRPGYFHGARGALHAGSRLVGADFRGSALGTRPVREIMTPATFSVQPDTPVPDVARFLLEPRIHRALVLERGRLRGIVTTFDIVRSVAEAAE